VDDAVVPPGVGEDDLVPPSVLDQVCLDAVDLARAAAVEIAPAGDVGEWVEAVAEGDRLVTHYFRCLSPSYDGWRWAVTIARVPRAKVPTVDEVVLLPAAGALLAPTWVPWDQRIAPGDLGVGDLLPTTADDPRLEPGYGGFDALAPADAYDGDAPLRPEQWQLGLGRLQVLSPWGRDEAAERWHDSDFGPESPMAKAAPAHCLTCGFMAPIGGALGQQFGLCANEMAPADGRVVDLGYGCGAHSETPQTDGTSVAIAAGIVADELTFEVSGAPGRPKEPLLFVVADEAVGNDVDLPDELVSVDAIGTALASPEVQTAAIIALEGGEDDAVTDVELAEARTQHGVEQAATVLAADE
jgi:hypothetical protein